MADIIRIQVITEEDTKFGKFRDAIYYTNQAAYDQAVLDGTHEAEKATRLTNYVTAVENPPAPVEPTKEELQEYKAQLEAQVAELDSKIITAKPKAEIGVIAEEIK